MNWFSRLLRRPQPTPPPMTWKTQFASYHRQGGNALLHYARSDAGTFEVYDDGRAFLLHFPKRMTLPAELFHDLGAAKQRAAAITQSARPT